MTKTASKLRLAGKFIRQTYLWICWVDQMSIVNTKKWWYVVRHTAKDDKVWHDFNLYLRSFE